MSHYSTPLNLSPSNLVETVYRWLNALRMTLVCSLLLDEKDGSSSSSSSGPSSSDSEAEDLGDLEERRKIHEPFLVHHSSLKVKDQPNSSL